MSWQVIGEKTSNEPNTIVSMLDTCLTSWIRQNNYKVWPNSNARNMTYLIPKVTMRIVLMPHVARVDAMIWARRTLSLPPHINLCITKLLTIAPSKLVNNCCNKQRIFIVTTCQRSCWKKHDIFGNHLFMAFYEASPLSQTGTPSSHDPSTAPSTDRAAPSPPCDCWKAGS